LQIGYPADLSRRKLRYSARHTGLFSPHRQIHYAINRTWLFVAIADYLTKFLRQAVWDAIDAGYRICKGDVQKWVQSAVDAFAGFDSEQPITKQVKLLLIRELTKHFK